MWNAGYSDAAHKRGGVEVEDNCPIIGLEIPIDEWIRGWF